MNSTVVEEKKEVNTKPDPPETLADFRIEVEEKKTAADVDEELQNHWDSNLKIDSSWDSVKICEGRFLIQIELEKGQSMSQLLLNMSWPEGYTLISTHTKKLVYHKYHKYK